MKTVKDISGIRSTYTNQLINDMDNINIKYADKTISAEDFICYIKNAITYAHDTPAKRNFIRVLESMRSKDHILQFIYSAVLSGCGMSAQKL